MRKAGVSLAYQSSLVDLVGRVRSDFFDGTDAPFVLTRFSDNQYGSLNSHVQAVRNAQTNVAGLLANVTTIDTDDNALYTVRPGNIIHFDANGQINLGSAIANEMLTLQVPEPSTCYLPSFSFRGDSAGGDSSDRA